MLILSSQKRQCAIESDLRSGNMDQDLINLIRMTQDTNGSQVAEVTIVQLWRWMSAACLGFGTAALLCVVEIFEFSGRTGAEIMAAMFNEILCPTKCAVSF